MELAKKIIEEKLKRLDQQRADAFRSRKIENKKRYWKGNLLTKTRLRDIYGPLNPYEIIIYEELGTYADAAGYCFPSMRTIAENRHIDKNTVKFYIHALEAKGFLKIGIKQGMRGKRHEYWLLK